MKKGRLYQEPTTNEWFVIGFTDIKKSIDGIEYVCDGLKYPLNKNDRIHDNIGEFRNGMQVNFIVNEEILGFSVSGDVTGFGQQIYTGENERISPVTRESAILKNIDTNMSENGEVYAVEINNEIIFFDKLNKKQVDALDILCGNYDDTKSSWDEILTRRVGSLIKMDDGSYEEIEKYLKNYFHPPVKKIF